MKVQHVNIKIFAEDPAPADLGDAIPVFHRWIQNKSTGDLLIDVADYRHVPEGPGVMLIAHEAHYALDVSESRLGLLYNRRVAESGDTILKLRQAHDAALAACERLEAEPEFQGKLKFNPGDVEVIFNDRYLTPNTPESFAELKPQLEVFFTELWGEDTAFDLRHVGESRDRLRVSVVVRKAELQAV